MASLPRFVRAHGSGFRAVLRINNRRHYGPTMRTPEEASAYADRFQNLRDERSGTAPKVWTVADACASLKAELERTTRPDTLDYYRQYLDRFRAVWGDDRPLHRITVRDVQLYIAKRENQVAPITLYGKELQVAGRLFLHAIRTGHLVRNPLASIRPPKIRRQRYGVMSREAIDEVVAQILARDYPEARQHADIVLLLFFTGLRLAEVGRLHVRDYAADTGQASLFVEGKTENRYQPVPTVLRPAIERFVAGKSPDDPLVGIGNRRLVSRVFELWKKRLQLPVLSAHVMRHSYATEMVRLGVDPFRLKCLMGHHSITMTDRYFHAASPDLHAAVERLAGRKPGSRGSRPRRGPKKGRRAPSRSTRRTQRP